MTPLLWLKVKYFHRAGLVLVLTLLIILAALKFICVHIREVPSDSNLQAGQIVTIKILSVSYIRAVPHISGQFVSTLQV